MFDVNFFDNRFYEKWYYFKNMWLKNRENFRFTCKIILSKECTVENEFDEFDE